MTTTRLLRRLATSTAITLAVVAGATGCGVGDERSRVDGQPPASEPTDATADATAATADATADAPEPAGGGPNDGGPDSSSSSSHGGYTSAIVDEVVDDPRFDDLEGDMTRRATAADLPGTSLLVLEDGALVEQEAWGTYTLDTVVPIASASKWLSGVVIMTLVDDGLLDLDEPIRTYLPDTGGRAGRITTRQLLAFTSGLEYDERIPCYGDTTMTLAECNRVILDLPLLGAPGSGFRYTGTHLHVAAGVAEAVTGQTWEALFRARVAEPLAMTDTTFISPSRRATATDGHPWPGGSAVSSLGDYGRFLEMLVHDGVAPDGTRIVSSEALAEMRSDQTIGANFLTAARHRKAAETPYGIAHWLDVVDEDGVAIVESSPGAFGFRPWIDHANGIAGVHLILDGFDERVADSPLLTGAPAAADVQTSGDYVLEGTAEALGGTLPEGGMGGLVRPQG